MAVTADGDEQFVGLALLDALVGGFGGRPGEDTPAQAQTQAFALVGGA